MKEVKGLTTGEFTVLTGTPDKSRGNLGSLILDRLKAEGREVVVIKTNFKDI